jgi:predicted homoserine dehydrogenase-like protein
VGPFLPSALAPRGLVYSMAYGDQPAMICELVDWVRACGFELTSAGKGMNFEPHCRYSSPTRSNLSGLAKRLAPLLRVSSPQ